VLTEADRLPDIIVQRFVLEGLRFKIVRWVMVLNREYVYEGRTHSLNKLFKIVELTKATDALIKIAWYRAKVGGKAALPPELRKASGFPPRTASLLALGSAGRLSLPAEPRGSVRVEAHGKAEPFRKSGGRAALECYPSRTLTRPCRSAADVLTGWEPEYDISTTDIHQHEGSR
jgi:predicted thioredoxin/glutaredoxin